MPTETPAEKVDQRKQPQPASGERRQITALFYDIIGSTALLGRFDPEDFGIAQQRIHAEAAAVFRRHGGYLDRVLGDGGCAYFGYPVPGEDAAESAVAAALELLERCSSLPIYAPIGVPLHIRVGIATGLAIISTKEGSQLDVIGLAPNLAARAQAEADQDTIVVSESAYRLTRSAFEYLSLGTHSLKGFDQPQHLWRPLRRRSSEDRFSLRRRVATPLLGREEELALCWRFWERAKAGHGQVVFLRGEPGIGKSRLVTELRRQASAGQGCETRVLQCQPRGNARPLHPFLDHIGRHSGAAVDPHAGLDMECLRTYLAASAPESATAINLILFVIGQPEAPETDDSEFAGVAGEELQQRIVAGVLEIISSWSRENPQLLIFEDVHWADALTRAVLAALVEKIESLPVLLVATTRDWLPGNVAETPHVLILTVGRLDAAAVRELVGAVFSPLMPPNGLDDFVQHHSEGVPLFAEELASLLKERLDGSENTPDHWERVLRKDGIITLQDLLAARLAGTGAARRVAQVASVIGREFSRSLLARLTEGEPVATALDDCLQHLMEAGLVWRLGREGDFAYRFEHVLIQDAAYESLLRSERREFHDRLVRIALAAGLEMPDELLSWHCAQAGRLVDAASYAIRAAEACAVRSATQDADRLLATAEGYLAGSSVGPEVDELTLELLATRGPIATALYGVGSPEARAIYERGISLCRDRAVGQAEKWFPLYWGWWFTAPDFGTQRTRSRTIIGDLDRAGDPEVRLQALHCAWATEFDAGNLASCLRSIERGLILYDPDRARLSRARYGGHDAKVCGLGERALSLWCTGENARESAKTALEWAEETGHRGSLCHALDITATLHFYERSIDEVAVVARRIQELGELHSLPGMIAKAKIFGGWAYAITTSVAEGLCRFSEGLDMLRVIGTEEDFPIYFDMHAELLARAGSFQPAVELLGRAIERAHRTGHVFWLPELYRRRAILHEAKDGAPDACLSDLRDSLGHAEAQGATMLAGRTRSEIERLSAEASVSSAPALLQPRAPLAVRSDPCA
jgi:predicted ATPase/class 3 adenylate cyclase